MRTINKIRIKDVPGFKTSLLQWAQNFKEIVWLDSNDHSNEYALYDAVLAVDAFTAVKTDSRDAFDQLREYQQLTKDWIFGYLSYDLKNDTEDLASNNFDGLHFPDLYFFQPKKLFLLKGDALEMHYLGMVDDEMEEDLQTILTSEEAGEEPPQQPIELRPRISKEDYIDKVGQMLEHIQRGDIYEANFCQEFFAGEVELKPHSTFKKLNELSRPPFAGYLRLYDHYLLSASPERFLQKRGNRIITQPIKGTAARDLANPQKDRELALSLEQDQKERSENIMIVDLVRNDLSKIANKGSVAVEELCKVYSFPQVHQMISTVSAEVSENLPAVEVLRSSFPMGSMTGAPKISAMKIIEQLEETKRGLYSGAVGYFTPNSDFDFNVVIRSILYNAEAQYVSLSVGGAITAGSDPFREYEECLLKASVLQKVLLQES